MSEPGETEVPDEMYERVPEVSERDAAEGDALEQYELADPPDVDDEPAIGMADASEADLLDQARAGPVDDDEW